MKTFPPTARSSGRCLARVSALALALAFFGAGCSGVYVLRPVGEKPHALVAADWEGVWVLDNNVTKITIASAAAGQLQMASIGRDAHGQPKLNLGTVFITQSGETLFASLRNEEDDAAKRPYLWARLSRDTDLVLLWFPDRQRFAELVRAGKLAGKVDGDDVLLEAPTAAQLAALVAGEFGPVFEPADSPQVLRRVAR